jgi:hypothetical protein
MSVSSRLMLYDVTDLLRTFLFIPDPFRLLLRSSVPNAAAVYLQFFPECAGQSIGHDATCFLDMAFELA